MLAAFKRRLTFANVVAVTALFVALGGSVYAGDKINGKTIKKNSEPGNRIKKGSTPGNRLKKNSVTGKQVKESTLGTVPRAALADSLAAPEGFHDVGAPGEPAFQNSWRNRGFVDDAPVGFYKDRESVVHLRGTACCGPINNDIFQLPPGYRPAKGVLVAAACECEQPFADPQGGAVTVLLPTGRVSILAGGGVRLGTSLPNGNNLWLDGITFRAGS
jgi:hypothetical protein